MFPCSSWLYWTLLMSQHNQVHPRQHVRFPSPWKASRMWQNWIYVSLNICTFILFIISSFEFYSIYNLMSFCVVFLQCNHEQCGQLHREILYEHWGEDGQGFFEMLGKVRYNLTNFRTTFCFKIWTSTRKWASWHPLLFSSTFMVLDWQTEVHIRSHFRPSKPLKTHWSNTY